MSSVTRLAQKVVNTGLSPLNVQIIRARSADPAVGWFIQARKTRAAARKAGLSVGDYVDQTFAAPGVTQAAVDAMISISGLTPENVNTVCEIGPGTGRYLEKVLSALRPTRYEIYETADDWITHLRNFPTVIAQPTDGRSLSATRDHSVDLAHAQKVFVYLDFWVTAGYLTEMARVLRPGGIAAFDIVSQDCTDDDTVAEWIREGSILQPIAKDWVLTFLEKRGLTYLDSHFTFLPPGRSELMVFRRTPTGVHN